MIERSSEVMDTALVGNNFLPVPSKNSYIWKKKSDL